MSVKTVFLSYRRDPVGKAFARALKDSLHHQGYDVFLDVDDIDAGLWASQILTEVPKRAHFLLLLTPGALDRCADADDWVRREFELAQQSGRNIVPVREESIDVAALSTSCPGCMGAVFNLQIAALRHGSYQADLTELMQRYIPAHKAPTITPALPAAGVKADISRIVKYAPTKLIGREAESQRLGAAWDQAVRNEPKRPHLLVFVALGGEGKTSLVAKWAAALAGQGWPGCDAVFAWSFYSQGSREQTTVSSDLFLKEALIFFGDQTMAESAAGAFDKGRRLARLVGEQRALLILDGLEPLQYPPTSPLPGELKDQGLAALLKGLATTSHGLCIVTTRYPIPDLAAFIGNTVHEQRLTRLSTEAGVALLQTLGVKGSPRKTIPSGDGRGLWNEFEQLVEEVKGHALTLNLLGSYLCDAHAGDIRRRDCIKLEEANAEEQGGHAFRVMDAYVLALASGGKTAEEQAKGRRALAILQLLGLFDRPATADCLKVLWQGETLVGLTEPLHGLKGTERNISLRRMEEARLLTVNRDQGSGLLLSLDTHPLLREYFAGRLQREQPEAWQAGHQKLFAHLCATTREGDQPTLEGLQPLYQAVAHGCQAGLHEEAQAKVYRDRIQRGEEGYSAKKLGAFGSDLGAVVCFFDTPWSRLSPTLTAADQSWLLNEAAYTLRGLGRLNEALEPIRVSVEMDTKVEDWQSAATSYGNLSELELTLGAVFGSMADAKRAVDCADRSGDAFQRMLSRTTHADALHQAGHLAEAEARFREAEQMQAERQPAHPQLYSLRGFRYCDLLLAEVEQKAGRVIRKPGGRGEEAALVQACHAVSQRAMQTLKWEEGMREAPLLDFALNHLTLGRVALYEAILSAAPLSAFTLSASHLQQAVAGLRRAGLQEFIVRGLFTRAWLRTLSGPASGPDSAQSDLDEAWEIAARGPMPLFLADIHLYRARLLAITNDELQIKNYPWESPQADLAEARRLIEKHGYLRRMPELEAAEAALNGSLGGAGETGLGC